MLRTIIDTMLNDQYLQSWYSYIDSSSKASSYKFWKILLYLKPLEKNPLVPIITF